MKPYAALIAERRRVLRPTALRPLLNLRAATRASADACPLVVSFVGQTHLANPHVFADPGTMHDWRPCAGLETIIALRPGLPIADALCELLALANVFLAYPVLMDVERRQIASLVHGRPIAIWPVTDGSSEWQRYFGA